MREHPTAKQGEYAEWLGVSQGRISQLKKLL
jgi:transcriptional pleiotropic regulator of transition state genes